MNSVLAKIVSSHQRDWECRLPFAMAAYRASRHPLFAELFDVRTRRYGGPDETDALMIDYDFVTDSQSNDRVVC